MGDASCGPAQVKRHPSYSLPAEKEHHGRAALAMRAAQNTKQATHVPLLCTWLGHHSEALATEALTALEAHMGTAADADTISAIEASLASQLSQELASRSPRSPQRRPTLVKRLLRVLGGLHTLSNGALHSWGSLATHA